MKKPIRNNRFVAAAAVLFVGLGLGVAIERSANRGEVAALQARVDQLEAERELLFSRRPSFDPPRLPPVPRVRVTIPGEGSSR